MLSRRQHRQLRSRRHSPVTMNDIGHHQRQAMTSTAAAAAAAAAAPAAAAPAGDDDDDAAAHHPVCHRTPKQNSTYLTEQISRRFPGDSRRDFKKNPGRLHCFGLLWDANACDHSDPVYPVLSKRSGTQMTGNQCGRSSYTKISRKTIK